ncbi:hypothetical protein C8Q76DRAFT_12720 [Earliella scabrosa]|nr:hypothetical protein C8Q76DRAFT_12720 [Earliella scabrosa]
MIGERNTASRSHIYGQAPHAHLPRCAYVTSPESVTAADSHGPPSVATVPSDPTRPASIRFADSKFTSRGHVRQVPFSTCEIHSCASRFSLPFSGSTRSCWLCTHARSSIRRPACFASPLHPTSYIMNVPHQSPPKLLYGIAADARTSICPEP